MLAIGKKHVNHFVGFEHVKKCKNLVKFLRNVETFFWNYISWKEQIRSIGLIYMVHVMNSIKIVESFLFCFPVSSFKANSTNIWTYSIFVCIKNNSQHTELNEQLFFSQYILGCASSCIILIVFASHSSFLFHLFKDNVIVCVRKNNNKKINILLGHSFFFNSLYFAYV